MGGDSVGLGLGTNCLVSEAACGNSFVEFVLSPGICTCSFGISERLVYKRTSLLSVRNSWTLRNTATHQ